jgi:glycerol-3-phosphate dehydrogenase
MALRETYLDGIDGAHFDVLIVGGGINGAVSAAVLAARGAKVCLVERGDFAGFTSQESSNLVWGGFKYLENYELLLVRKLCMSRNRLIKAYPANVTEIGFLAALDHTSPFPPWLAAVGSTAYWAMGNFKTKRPEFLSPEEIEEREPVIDTSEVRGGIEYRDAYLKDNDARFVFSFVRGALDMGASCVNYVELCGAERIDGTWHAKLADVEGGRQLACTAEVVVNAAGPFVDDINGPWGLRTEHRVVYSKGIHLVVPRVTEAERVLAFFDDTQRLFYVIPMGNRSVIGTTDTRVDSPESFVTAEDREFLLAQINERLDLANPLVADDVISERCGVRPLVVENDGDDKKNVDWTSLSRKHEIEADDDLNVITIFGGKLTDCLNVGEEVALCIGALGIPLERDRKDWYGEPGRDSRKAFYKQAEGMDLDGLRVRPGLEKLSDRLWRRYGRRAFPMLEAIREDPSMGEDILESTDYLRVELHLAAQSEMIIKLDDFLRRRSKIAMVVGDAVVSESDGLREVAEILFGEQADEKLIEYFGKMPPGAMVSA